MNFNEYLNNVLNGKLLTEMQQNDEFLSGNEISEYKKLFLYAIKYKKFSPHFNVSGSDKYPEGSDTLKNHISANNYILSISKKLKNIDDNELISNINNLYPIAKSSMNRGVEGAIIALVVDSACNMLYEIIGSGTTNEDFSIITAYRIADKNMLLAYAFKLRNTEIGQIIMQKMIKKKFEDIIPPEIDLKTFEDNLWKDAQSDRSQRRKDDIDTQCDNIIKLIADIYKNESKDETIKNLNDLFIPMIDVNKLPSEIRTHITRASCKLTEPKKVNKILSAKLVQYIENLKKSN